MKKAICFDPLNAMGNPVYLVGERYMSALIYEYGTYFNLLETDEFKKFFYPLDDWHRLVPSNFNPLLEGFLPLINEFSPKSIGEHIFMSTFITYLYIFNGGTAFYSKYAYETSLLNSVYFIPIDMKGDVKPWFERLTSIAINIF